MTVNDITNKFEDFKNAIGFKVLSLDITKDKSTALVDMNGIRLKVYYDNNQNKWF